MKRLLIGLAMALAMGCCSADEWKEDISFTGQESGSVYHACQEDFLEYASDEYSKTITFYVLGFGKEQVEDLSRKVDVVEVTDYYVVYRYSSVEVVPCAHERM